MSDEKCRKSGEDEANARKHGDAPVASERTGEQVGESGRAFSTPDTATQDILKRTVRDREDVVRAFDQYVESNHTLEEGLTADKIQNRACNTEVRGGKLYFSMDRHEPLAFAQYRRGSPMPAMLATHVRYVFDPGNPSIEEFETGQPRVVINDIGAWAEDVCDGDSIFVEKLDNGHFRVRCNVWSWDQEVKDYDEAAIVIERKVSDWPLEDLVLPGLEDIEGAADVGRRACGLLSEECVRVMLAKLKWAWSKSGEQP